MTAKLHQTRDFAVKALVLTLFVFTFSCKKENFERVAVNSSDNSSATAAQKPNIVLILMDDVGYEVPGYTGGQSYSTPAIDMLAQSGLQFSQMQAAPNCSPSRNMLLTGKYNFRNYIDWGILDTTQSTFANLLHDQGYATCIAGKWQMDGGDASIRGAGFDKYLIWLPYRDNESSENWYRYKNPHLYENGAMLPESETNGKYSEDMFTEYISNFIDSNRTNPFFVYYSMSLAHYPFTPTPDDPDYATWTPESHTSRIRYFPSMVKYMDKKIQEVVTKINESGLASNTIIMVLGDNGTPEQISSLWRGQTVSGGKGSTTQFGTHVPMIVSWPGHIFPGTIDTNLTDLTDFLPTMANIARTSVPASYGTTDGVSFYSALKNNLAPKRKWVFCQWQSFTTAPVSSFNKWAQTLSYKLYDDSVHGHKFYNIVKDTLEQNSIKRSTITPEEQTIKRQLQQVINNMHN